MKNMGTFTINGQAVVYLKCEDDGHLAFPEQVEGNGIKLASLLEPGYAYVAGDGRVWRENRIIGHIDDLFRR